MILLLSVIPKIKLPFSLLQSLISMVLLIISLEEACTARQKVKRLDFSVMIVKVETRDKRETREQNRAQERGASDLRLAFPFFSP